MDGSFKTAGTINRGVLKGLIVQAEPCASDRQIVMVSGMSGVFLEIAAESLSIGGAPLRLTSCSGCEGKAFL
jgi:hypothetical protein